jgi:hypothetical protein
MTVDNGAFLDKALAAFQYLLIHLASGVQVAADDKIAWNAKGIFFRISGKGFKKTIHPQNT